MAGNDDCELKCYCKSLNVRPTQTFLFMNADDFQKSFMCRYPANTKHSPNAGLMLGQRRRQWATLRERIMFAGYLVILVEKTG